jgi:hypothetical protein
MGSTATLSNNKKPDSLDNNQNLKTKDELVKSRKLRANDSINRKNPYKTLSPSHMRPTYSSMRRDNRIKARISENPIKSTRVRDKSTGVKRVSNREVKGLLSDKVNSESNQAQKKLKTNVKRAEVKKLQGKKKAIGKSKKATGTKLREEVRYLTPNIQEPGEELEIDNLISNADVKNDKEQSLIAENDPEVQETKADDFAAPLPITRSISPNLKLKFSVRGIKLIGPLGKGTTSSVWLVAQRRSGFKYAIKYVKKSVIAEKGIGEQIMREFNNQYPLEHPNIIQSYYYFVDNTGIYTAQEFGCYGQLIDLIHKSKHLSEVRAAKYTAQLADVLWYLRLKNIIHRDLKPENLLLDKQHNLKLTDFGSSICLENIAERRRTYCGTVDYISPELLQESSIHAVSTDYWSLGCVIYEMLVGKPPFDGYCKAVTMEKIKNLDYKFPPHVTELAQDLIKKLIVLSPADRLTPEQVLDHPWIKRNSPNYTCFTKSFISLKDEE